MRNFKKICQKYILNENFLKDGFLRKYNFETGDAIINVSYFSFRYLPLLTSTKTIIGSVIGFIILYFKVLLPLWK